MKSRDLGVTAETLIRLMELSKCKYIQDKLHDNVWYESGVRNMELTLQEDGFNFRMYRNSSDYVPEISTWIRYSDCELNDRFNNCINIPGGYIAL